MVEEIYEASGEQTQFWIGQTQDGQTQELQVLSIEFTVPDADVGLIEKSISTLQKRHESLRSYLKSVDGQIRQCVVPYSSELFAPLYFDLSNDPDVEQAKAEIRDAIAGTLNNVSIPPLLKCGIIRCPGELYTIYVMIHHVIADDWSKVILHKELTHLYGSFATGRNIAGDPLPMQSREYAGLQKRWMAENGDSAREYWHMVLTRSDKQHLYDRLYARNPLFERPPAIATGTASSTTTGTITTTTTGTAHIIYFITGPEFMRLSHFARCCNASLFALMFSSVQLLFFLLAGRRSIVISTPFANRHVPGTETVIGWLMGTIYLNRELRQDITIREMVKTGHIDFARSCKYPIYNHHEILGKDHRVPADLFMNFTGKAFRTKKTVGASGSEQRYTENKVSFFELAFLIGEFEDALSCHWLYNVGVYSTGLIDHILATYKKLLKLMVDYPEASIRTLESQLLT